MSFSPGKVCTQASQTCCDKRIFTYQKLHIGIDIIFTIKVNPNKEENLNTERQQRTPRNSMDEFLVELVFQQELCSGTTLPFSKLLLPY